MEKDKAFENGEAFGYILVSRAPSFDPRFVIFATYKTRASIERYKKRLEEQEPYPRYAIRLVDRDFYFSVHRRKKPVRQMSKNPAADVLTLEDDEDDYPF